MRVALNEQLRALEQLSSLSARERRDVSPPGPLPSAAAPPSLTQGYGVPPGAPPPPPPLQADNGGERWSLGDLLARASRDDDGVARAPVALDLQGIAGALDPTTASAIWSRFRAGQRGIMVRSHLHDRGARELRRGERALRPRSRLPSHRRPLPLRLRAAGSRHRAAKPARACTAIWSPTPAASISSSPTPAGDCADEVIPLFPLAGRGTWSPMPTLTIEAVVETLANRRRVRHRARGQAGGGGRRCAGERRKDHRARRVCALCALRRDGGRCARRHPGHARGAVRSRGPVAADAGGCRAQRTGLRAVGLRGEALRHICSGAGGTGGPASPHHRLHHQPRQPRGHGRQGRRRGPHHAAPQAQARWPGRRRAPASGSRRLSGRAPDRRRQRGLDARAAALADGSCGRDRRRADRAAVARRRRCGARRAAPGAGVRRRVRCTTAPASRPWPGATMPSTSSSTRPAG